MALKVGSARHDENGRYTNGKSGDQTGTEVSKQNYYTHSKGWYLIRPKNPTIATRIANAMNSACDNNHIGYSQSDRYGIVNAVKKYGTIAKIPVNVNSDCSSTVRACCIEAGFDPGDFNTASEVSVLMNTGKFEKSISVNSSTILYDGDILVTKTKGHTVIVTGGNARNPIKASYTAHVQDEGWLLPVGNGDVCGTTGKSQRMEAIKINPNGKTIKVRVHISDIGWTTFKTIASETEFGTTGQSKAIEAIEIIGVDCTVKYQAHMANIGWGKIYTNGGISGTTGRSIPIEAMKIWIS